MVIVVVEERVIFLCWNCPELSSVVAQLPRARRGAASLHPRGLFTLARGANNYTMGLLGRIANRIMHVAEDLFHEAGRLLSTWVFRGAFSQF